MTEQEAQRIIAEHRTERPTFVRGRQRYDVRRDGRVDIYRAIGNRGQRWAFELTVNRDSYALHPDVRAAQSA